MTDEDDEGPIIDEALAPVLRRLSSASVLSLHQILLRDGRSEPVVVLDEIVDELVQSGLEDFLDATVLQPSPDRTRLALRVALAAIGAGDAVEILHKVLVAARKRARHFVLEHEQIGDQPGLDVLAIDPVIGGERRDRAQDRRPLVIVERAADLFRSAGSSR